MVAANTQKIVLVDDDADITLTTRLFFVARGYDVWVANSGIAALNLIRQVMPHVVFCEIDMPGMNGHQVARAIRSDHSLRNIRLFAVTGSGEEEDIAQSFSSGFERHFLKPPPLQDMAARIESGTSAHRDVLKSETQRAPQQGRVDSN